MCCSSDIYCTHMCTYKAPDIYVKILVNLTFKLVAFGISAGYSVIYHIGQGVSKVFL